MILKVVYYDFRKFTNWSLVFMFYLDAHNHLCNSKYPNSLFDDEYFCISSFCLKSEWNDFFHHEKQNILKSFGIHPQMFSSFDFDEKIYESKIEFLENLLIENKIFAIGEIGFDFFTFELKSTREQQEKYWNLQLDLAIKYEKPIIIHCRKAIERIFADSEKLKKLPAVIFHSFSGTEMDAKSLLNKKINAFFSFGKHQIFNEKKASIEMLKNYRNFENRIFLETDCPYQTLKNETETKSEEIALVYKKSNELFKTDFSVLTKSSFDFLLSCN